MDTCLITTFQLKRWVKTFAKFAPPPPSLIAKHVHTTLKCNNKYQDISCCDDNEDLSRERSEEGEVLAGADLVRRGSPSDRRKPRVHEGGDEIHVCLTCAGDGHVRRRDVCFLHVQNNVLLL